MVHPDLVARDAGESKGPTPVRRPRARFDFDRNGSGCDHDCEASVATTHDRRPWVDMSWCRSPPRVRRILFIAADFLLIRRFALSFCFDDRSRPRIRRHLLLIRNLFPNVSPSCSNADRAADHPTAS